MIRHRFQGLVWLVPTLLALLAIFWPTAPPVGAASGKAVGHQSGTFIHLATAVRPLAVDPPTCAASGDALPVISESCFLGRSGKQSSPGCEEALSTMIDIGPLSAVFSLLCLMIALFYLFRLIGGRIWMSHSDAENEVGHGLMAIGMIVMLAPAGLLTSALIRWNMLLFALASLWWTFRLLAQKPLLAVLLGTNGECSPFQSDAIHVFMHVGMCYMFLLMSSMALSMTSPAISVNGIFCVSFAFLTLFFGREISKDLHSAQLDRLQLGANIAHVLMSAMMCWMFLAMITMTMRMMGTF